MAASRPGPLVSVALDRASALLVGALDVQSVSMASLAVPRWSDFVLLHRVKNGGEWQVSGELQSSDARWLKTAEVVLAPRTAKSQASQVSGCDGVNEREAPNVTLVDAVSSQSVVVEVSHLVRSIPDPGCDGVNEREAPNVTLVDAVSSQSVVVEVSHLVRSIPDPRSLVSTALLQPIVVENREDEPALVSMADLGALVRQRDCKMS
ncbi:hypothetical protein PInf_021522 [Phytophthora infestans]|nr:hypothetical protein PInf_021522 [Phytophthora infestans]